MLDDDNLCCVRCGSPHVYWRPMPQYDKRHRYVGEMRVLFNEEGGRHDCGPAPQPEHNDA